MKRLNGLALTSVVVMLLACGSSSKKADGSASVSSSGAISFTVTDEVGLIGTTTSNGVSVAYAGAIITNLAGTCSLLEQQSNPPNAQGIVINVGMAGSSVPTGTYSIDGSGVVVGFASVDASCATTVNETATGGTITLTAVSESTIQGSFDVTFASGDGLTGTFDAPVCNANAQGFNSSAACGG